MKNLIILVGSFLFVVGCVAFQEKAPRFPEEIVNFYLLDASESPVGFDENFLKLMDNPQDLPTVYPYDIQLACLKFDIISKHPFKLRYVGMAEFIDCRAIGGFKPADHQKFYNFLHDLEEWAWHREKK